MDYESAHRLATLYRSGGPPKLQPTAYDPIAQFAVDDSRTTSPIDRSGGLVARGYTLTSGYTLGPSGFSPGIENYYGSIYALTYNSPAYSSLYLRDKAITEHPLFTYDELTITCVAKRFVSQANQTIVSLAYDVWNSAESQNIVYLWKFDSSSLVYLHEAGNGVAKTFSAALDASKRQTQRWYFLSLRRTADGTITLGVDDQFFTSAALGRPTGGTAASNLDVGCCFAPAGPGRTDFFGGAIADLCLWRKWLTDGQTLSLYKAAMGR